MTNPNERWRVYAASGEGNSLPNRTIPERRRCETSVTTTCSILIQGN